jgi:hypothetical protein
MGAAAAIAGGLPAAAAERVMVNAGNVSEEGQLQGGGPSGQGGRGCAQEESSPAKHSIRGARALKKRSRGDAQLRMLRFVVGK